MPDKTTLVVTALPDPAEMPAVQGYLKAVLPLLLGAGGRIVKRLKVTEVLNGDPSGMVLVMDFDSERAVRDLFASDAYAALVPTRDRGFRQFDMLIAQEM